MEQTMTWPEASIVIVVLLVIGAILVTVLRS